MASRLLNLHKYLAADLHICQRSSARIWAGEAPASDPGVGNSDPGVGKHAGKCVHKPKPAPPCRSVGSTLLFRLVCNHETRVHGPQLESPRAPVPPGCAVCIFLANRRHDRRAKSAVPVAFLFVRKQIIKS